MLKFDERIRAFVRDVNTFLTVGLQNEKLSPTASSSRTELVQKMLRLCQEYPPLLLSLDFPSPEQMQGWKVERPLSSPHPYIDMQVGGVLGPRDFPTAADDNNEYVYSDTVLREDLPGEVAEPAAAKTKLSMPSLSRTSSELDDQGEEGPLIPIPASEMSRADKTGYLEKKGKERLGGLLSSYQKRWCAVRDGVLYLYDKPTDKRQKDQITLSMYEARPFVYTASKDASKKDAAFEIVCPGKKTYQFIAFNAKDMQQWISAIEKNSEVSPSASPMGSCAGSSVDVSQLPPPLPPLTQSQSSLSKPPPLPPSPRPPSPRQEPPPRRVPPLPVEPENDRELEYEYVEGQTTTTAAPTEEDGEEIYEDGDFPDEPKASGSPLTDEEVAGDYESWYQAIWDCHSGQPDELSFRRGDLLKVVSKEYDRHSWWVAQAHGSKGGVGFVPKTYLMAAYERVQ
ncbi:src kinase-associated phosphoprotein 2-like [Haemaphysalis longicornis]